MCLYLINTNVLSQMRPGLSTSPRLFFPDDTPARLSFSQDGAAPIFAAPKSINILVAACENDGLYDPVFSVHPDVKKKAVIIYNPFALKSKQMNFSSYKTLSLPQLFISEDRSLES